MCYEVVCKTYFIFKHMCDLFQPTIIHASGVELLSNMGRTSTGYCGKRLTYTFMIKLMVNSLYNLKNDQIVWSIEMSFVGFVPPPPRDVKQFF